jgi:ribonuclease BN (tRNA processing enzyme)
MLMLDRRMLLRAGSAAAAAAALAPTAPALAHAPQAGPRAQPGFYRLKLGTIEITVVSDGTLAFPAETPWGDRAEDARGLLTSTFHTPRPVVAQINTTLVNTGDKLVLIDAGCGVDKFQNTTGRLLGNLAAAGYAPGDIDMILFTHAHFDHLWGISDGENASLLFPSAEFVASETEVVFWSDPELAGKLPPAQLPSVTQKNLKIGQPPAASDQGRGGGGAGRDHLRHRRSHARPHLGSHRFRERRNAPHRRRRVRLRGQLPASGMAVQVRHRRATGNQGAHGLPRPRSGRQDAGR